MLKDDIGGEREVSDDAAGLKVPLRITEGTRGVSFQLFKSPHGLSEQEPTEEACRQCTYLLGPADEASPALISDVSQQTPPHADIARKYDGQSMCSRLTLSFNSSIRPCSSRWRPHLGALSSASALAILSRRLLISSSGMCSMKSAAISLLTISGHLDGIQITCSHRTMRGGGIFSRSPQGVLNVLLVQVFGYLLGTFRSSIVSGGSTTSLGRSKNTSLKIPDRIR